MPALCTGYHGGGGRKICNFPGILLQSGSKMLGIDCKTAPAADARPPLAASAPLPPAGPPRGACGVPGRAGCCPGSRWAPRWQSPVEGLGCVRCPSRAGGTAGLEGGQGDGGLVARGDVLVSRAVFTAQASAQSAQFLQCGRPGWWHGETGDVPMSKVAFTAQTSAPSAQFVECGWLGWGNGVTSR